MEAGSKTGLVIAANDARAGLSLNMQTAHNGTHTAAITHARSPPGTTVGDRELTSRKKQRAVHELNGVLQFGRGHRGFDIVRHHITSPRARQDRHSDLRPPAIPRAVLDEVRGLLADVVVSACKTVAGSGFQSPVARSD